MRVPHNLFIGNSTPSDASAMIYADITPITATTPINSIYQFRLANV